MLQNGLLKKQTSKRTTLSNREHGHGLETLFMFYLSDFLQVFYVTLLLPSSKTSITGKQLRLLRQSVDFGSSALQLVSEMETVLDPIVTSANTSLTHLSIV